jgi:hypothetical protein
MDSCGQVDWEWIPNGKLKSVGIEEVEQEVKFRLVLRIENAFVRKLVHAMVKFYHQSSTSRDVVQDGRVVRLTTVWWSRRVGKMETFTRRMYA